MKKFLVPVDFSEYSENTCQYALRLAAVIGAEIKLLHSFLDPIVDVPVPMYDFGGYEEMHNELLVEAESHEKQMLESLYEKLQRQISQAHLEKVVLAPFSFRKGFPDEEIVDEADTYQPDLIIMAGKGKSGLMKGIFGSVTEDVIEKCKCPVMVIPPGRAPFPRGQVMYATNYDENDQKSIVDLIDLLATLKNKLYFVHICFGAMDRDDKVNMVKIKSFVEKKYPGQDIVFDILESENILEGFDHYVETNHIDLIAVTTHKRSFLNKYFSPSFTRRLISHSRIPILVFQ